MSVSNSQVAVCRTKEQALARTSVLILPAAKSVLKSGSLSHNLYTAFPLKAGTPFAGQSGTGRDSETKKKCDQPMIARRTGCFHNLLNCIEFRSILRHTNPTCCGVLCGDSLPWTRRRSR